MFDETYRALMEADPDSKVAAVIALQAQWECGALSFNDTIAEVLPVLVPGRPTRPILIAPQALVQRKLSTLPGRAALLHAVTHIEFNAINLALDAVYRFRGMPECYYGDWLQVAVEEVRHFCLLRTHLDELGYCYGDFPAHNGLWEMAIATSHDHVARMALVPRILEARGLDVTPGMRDKLIQAGDHRAGEILDVILRDEIGHVAIGNRWYHALCQRRRLDSQLVFAQLVQNYPVPRFRGPLNRQARLAAGFSEFDLDMLDRLFNERRPEPI